MGIKVGDDVGGGKRDWIMYGLAGICRLAFMMRWEAIFRGSPEK